MDTIHVCGVPGSSRTEAVDSIVHEFESQDYKRFDETDLAVQNPTMRPGYICVVDFEAFMAREVKRRIRPEAAELAVAHFDRMVRQFDKMRVPRGTRKVIVHDTFNIVSRLHDATSWHHYDFWPHIRSTTTDEMLGDYAAWTLTNYLASNNRIDLSSECKTRIHSESMFLTFGVSFDDMTPEDRETGRGRFDAYVEAHPLVDQVRMVVYPTFFME